MSADRARLWWGVGLVAAAVGGGVIFRVGWNRQVGSQSTVVLTDNMEATLHQGEMISYEPGVYGQELPRRGEIILCRFGASQIPTAYRVVALPGESVEIRGAQVYLDKKLLPEPYVRALPAAADEEAGGQPTVEVPSGPYLVPKDGVFVRGDNRGSRSRTWGIAQRDQIAGRALRILWSVRDWKRIGKRIQTLSAAERGQRGRRQ